MRTINLSTLIFILFSLTAQGQSNSIGLSTLLSCFAKGQTDMIEYASNLNLEYSGVEEVDSEFKTLKFRKSYDFQLNLTYELARNKCVFTQLVCTDNKTFYKIKKEILNLNPQFIKTYNEDNGVISIYKGNKYTYRIITDYINGVRINIITIKPNT